MSTVLRPQIISRSLAPNSHHQHKPFPQMFSVFNPWEGLGSSDITCFPLTRREPSLRTESWNATEWERHVPEARAKMFSWETYSRLHHPVPWVTHSLLLPCLGAGRRREAGFGQLASSNPVTDPDSECEQPCPSCGCFLERNDLALGTGAEKEHQEIICIRELLSFLLHKFGFLRMNLIVSHAHLLVFSNF